MTNAKSSLSETVTLYVLAFLRHQLTSCGGGVRSICIGRLSIYTLLLFITYHDTITVLYCACVKMLLVLYCVD